MREQWEIEWKRGYWRRPRAEECADKFGGGGIAWWKPGAGANGGGVGGEEALQVQDGQHGAMRRYSGAVVAQDAAERRLRRRGNTHVAAAFGYDGLCDFKDALRRPGTLRKAGGCAE